MKKKDNYYICIWIKHFLWSCPEKTALQSFASLVAILARVTNKYLIHQQILASQQVCPRLAQVFVRD